MAYNLQSPVSSLQKSPVRPDQGLSSWNLSPLVSLPISMIQQCDYVEENQEPFFFKDHCKRTKNLGLLNGILLTLETK